MSEAVDYDLVILGGGPGGYVAAIRAGQLGLKVALIEREGVGGTCLHHGCIPSKTLIRNAEVLSLIQRASDFGISVENIRPDFGQTIDRSQKVIQKLYGGLQSLMKKHKVTVYPGTGRFTSANTLVVEGGQPPHSVTGRSVIIATGSHVQGLPHLSVDGRRVFTSDEALKLRTLPKSVAIIGGGAVGVELAYVYSVYGAHVSLIEMAPALLPNEDREVSSLLEKSFKKRGIDVMTGAQIHAIHDKTDHFSIQVEGRDQPCLTETILVAIGRAPNVEGMGVEAIGLRLHEKSRHILVDDQMRTNVDHLYAIGDVTTRPALAHGAMAQGIFIVELMTGQCPPPIALSSVPNAVYCQPQVASVGLTQEGARRAGYNVKIGKFPYAANGKAVAMDETEGFVKVVCDATSHKILGAHIVGAEATELIGEFVLARTMQASLEDLYQSIHPHPTLSEIIMEVGRGVSGTAIHF